MPSELHVVAELPQFVRDADRMGLSVHELQTVVNEIAANPLQGDEIRGSGGVRKVRFAGRGKGKSGGYRLITFHAAEDIPVFLLNISPRTRRPI